MHWIAVVPVSCLRLQVEPLLHEDGLIANIPRRIGRLPGIGKVKQRRVRFGEANGAGVMPQPQRTLQHLPLQQRNDHTAVRTLHLRPPDSCQAPRLLRGSFSAANDALQVPRPAVRWAAREHLESLFPQCGYICDDHHIGIVTIGERGGPQHVIFGPSRL